MWLYDGNNTVTTSTGWLGSLLLGDGQDTVSLGSGGCAQVTMYGGADTLAVSQLGNAEDICMFNGGKGIDSISFANFTVAVNISLASSNAVDTGMGIFIIYNFENLTGGSGNDTLTGNTLANRLDGGGGDNSLTGGGGADVFVYASSHDTDTITDFSKAQGDKIDLSGLNIRSFTELSTGHMAQNGSDTEISDGSGDILILKGVTMDDLTAAQFDF
jgi:Ca2+-binding RTX toxin-like protein